ncbi:ABC-2 type transport system permease protein [Streptomyces sp. CZ24]|uniref:ABC transporter permease n=1 Tax=Streptomyces TaxID=1883 RepID=UPI00099DE89D|nr:MULTISPECIES: ABC transporter permease [Streptomyces]MBL0779403.1 ABC transporter permease [Streptomyces albidoflavus]MBL0799716.1 ABC transporter permease [Streptomyces albidoflavus]MBV1957342.1 ABC transporter permease [Streptomyces sp. BV333]MCG5122897.1 ABC transporter permease [Streptomyces sp. T7(2022)]MCK2145448.1 ABC transporter permease [Streptomyces sp. WAC00276]
MPALAKMTYVEAKLLLRDPASAIMTLAFPLFLMTIFGIIPGFREPFEGFGGQAVIDTFVPSVVVLVVLSILALSVMPVYLATYRERGVLRRLSASPVHPAKLLAAQIVVNLLMALAAAVLLIAFAALAFDVSPPADLAGFAVAFLLGTTTLLSLGMLVAAFAPSSKAATAIGLILMFPLMFLAGVWTPVEMLPGVLGSIGTATPMGAVLQALRDSWGGDPAQPWLLALMAGYSVVFAAVAARCFRWE